MPRRALGSARNERIVVVCAATQNRYDPGRRLIYEAERETEGSFAFSAESDGDYQICFSNRMSTLTPKTVSMFIIIGKAPKKGANAALEPLEAEIRQISQGVEELKNGQVRACACSSAVWAWAMTS
jgi:hypothetical protein